MEGRRIRAICARIAASTFALLPTTAFGQKSSPDPRAPVSGAETAVIVPMPAQPGHAVVPGSPGAVVTQAQPGPVVEAESEAAVAQEQPGPVRGFVQRMWGYVDPDNAEIISVHQLACLIDDLDKDLYCQGQVVVKGPDVWGQNRMTAFRAEYEDQMKSQLGNFELILSSYQRRADLAALTSATSIGASVGPRVSNSRNVSTTTNVTPASTSSIPSAAGLVGPSGLTENANTLIGTMSPLLMPSNLTALALANKGATPGIGLEPSVVLDERSQFLNHLHQLRRLNAGDDKSDLPGYSLYLVRVPISVLPGDKSIKGKGAMVTIQVKHDLTPDLLANTFRNVVILDTAYQLMDAVSRGQYLTLKEMDYNKCASEMDQSGVNPCMTKLADSTSISDPIIATKLPLDEPQSRAEPGSKPQRGFSSPGPNSGRSPGNQGTGPSSEVIAIYGEDNLRRLVCAVSSDQQSWYRHDPSIVSWLLSELAAAHDYMREQARLGNPAFHPAVVENIGHHALTRNYKALKVHRENWLLTSVKARSDQQVRPIDVLAYALMVQSVFVDRRLKQDMMVMGQRKSCNCGDPSRYLFHALWPDPAAQQAFNAYAACKWPIHVFSLDPAVDQQNQLDLFSQRTELQLALAAAVATGQVDIQNATTYARRLEQDLAAVNLNRTTVGFGAGETTFGWRFYPRIQTPPTQSNPRRILGILVNNGPGPDYALNNLRIEPGLRECDALMVVPNFVPVIKLTTVTNWFDLKTCHPEQVLETTDMVHLSRKLQTARNAMQRLCDSGKYRPVDLEVLHDRLSQLEAMLPMQSHQVQLPFEADLSGSEIFNSTNAGLAPRLLTWYGEPGQAGGSVFLLGTGFTVREMKIIVGGVTLKESIPGAFQPLNTPSIPTFEIVSRNVIRIDIPKQAKTVDTEVSIDYKSNPDPKNPSYVETTRKPRRVIDVHVATPNGISNHLLVEVPPAPPGGDPKDPQTITTTVTTTTKPNPADGSSQTMTEYKTSPPGIVLPPGTYLPMGGNLPPGGTLVAPGAATFNLGQPGFLPGTVPNTSYSPPGAAQSGHVTAVDKPSENQQTGPHPAMPRSNEENYQKLSPPPDAPPTTPGQKPKPTNPTPTTGDQTKPAGETERSKARPQPAEPGMPSTPGAAVRSLDPNVQTAAVRSPRADRRPWRIFGEPRPPASVPSRPRQTTAPPPGARRSIFSRAIRDGQ